MTVERRHHVQVAGNGPATLFLAHGFGCDQTMWRLVQPVCAGRFRTVTFDLVGAGHSDLSAYDPEKYSSLQGYADDVLELVKEFGQGPVVFVGHSVSAMIGLLADLKAPGRIAAHIMVAPSPCYVNDGAYVGGFERHDIDALLSTMDNNYLAWSGTMAPVIMGAPDRPELGAELASSFCRTDPDIARQFARVTFLSDHRAQLPRLKTPTLILQCSDDLMAPVSVGHYMRQALPNGTLKIIQNIGHCPHLSAPDAISDAIIAFLGCEKPGIESAEAACAREPEKPANQESPQDVLDQAPCGLVQTDCARTAAPGQPGVLRLAGLHPGRTGRKAQAPGPADHGLPHFSPDAFAAGAAGAGLHLGGAGADGAQERRAAAHAAQCAPARAAWRRGG